MRERLSHIQCLAKRKTVTTKDGTEGVPGNYVTGELEIPSTAVDENNVSYSVVSIGNYSFYGRNRLTTVTIPESVITIGEYAFNKCTALTTISIPHNVSSIGKGAFFDCSTLASVTLGNSLRTIGNSAFCFTEITSVTIPNSVTTIEQGAFAYCSKLSSVTIPASITVLGEYIFDMSYGLKSIYYNADEPIEGPKNMFVTYDRGAVLYVPEVAVEKCKSMNPWMNFKKIEAYDFSQSAVDEILTDENSGELPMYDLYGRKISEPQKGQIYVKGGKKFIQN